MSWPHARHRTGSPVWKYDRPIFPAPSSGRMFPSLRHRFVYIFEPHFYTALRFGPRCPPPGVPLAQATSVSNPFFRENSLRGGACVSDDWPDSVAIDCRLLKALCCRSALRPFLSEDGADLCRRHAGRRKPRESAVGTLRRTCAAGMFRLSGAFGKVRFRNLHVLPATRSFVKYPGMMYGFLKFCFIFVSRVCRKRVIGSLTIRV